MQAKLSAVINDVQYAGEEEKTWMDISTLDDVWDWLDAAADAINPAAEADDESELACTQYVALTTMVSLMLVPLV